MKKYIDQNRSLKSYEGTIGFRLLEREKLNVTACHVIIFGKRKRTWYYLKIYLNGGEIDENNPSSGNMCYREAEGSYITALNEVYTVMSYADKYNLKVKYKIELDESVFICKSCKEIEVLDGFEDNDRGICYRCLYLEKLRKDQEKLKALEERHKRVESKAVRYIYIISIVNSTHYKIGLCNHLANRVSTLQIGTPYTLKTIAHFEIKAKGAYSLEKKLHCRYAKNRIRGEWFNFDNIDQVVDEVKDIIEEYTGKRGGHHGIQ